MNNELTNTELLRQVRDRAKSKRKGANAFKKAVPIVKNIIDADIYERFGITLRCPYCESKDYVKNGSGRFKCKTCEKTFKYLTNTFMDGYSYSADEWREIVRMCLLDVPLDQMIISNKVLPKSKAWLLKHKVMDAIKRIAQPKLTGIVQIDETSFRESQKGSHNLVSFYAKDHVRLPRRRYEASITGIKGSEWITCIGAVDSFNHARAKCVCLGDMSYLDLKNTLNGIIDTPSFLCSDNNPLYEDWCQVHKCRHWIQPSTYRRTRILYGYINRSNKHPNLSDDELKKNSQIDKEMWAEHSGPHITNAGKMSYETYQALVRNNKLTINSVNGLHSELKRKIVSLNKNVGSQYLDEYVALIVYLWNFNTDHGHKYTGNVNDTDLIIKEMLNNYSKTSISDFNNKKISSFIDQHENKKHAKKIKEARQFIVVKNNAFEGESEISEIFDKRKCFRAMNIKRVNQLCKVFGIPIKGKYKTQKRDALATLPEADEIIFREIYLMYYASDEEIEEARDNGYLRKLKTHKRGRPKKVS